MQSVYLSTVLFCFCENTFKLFSSLNVSLFENSDVSASFENSNFLKILFAVCLLVYSIFQAFLVRGKFFKNFFFFKYHSPQIIKWRNYIFTIRFFLPYT